MTGPQTPNPTTAEWKPEKIPTSHSMTRGRGHLKTVQPIQTTGKSAGLKVSNVAKEAPLSSNAKSNIDPSEPPNPSPSSRHAAPSPPVPSTPLPSPRAQPARRGRAPGPPLSHQNPQSRYSSRLRGPTQPTISYRPPAQPPGRADSTSSTPKSIQPTMSYLPPAPSQGRADSASSTPKPEDPLQAQRPNKPIQNSEADPPFLYPELDPSPYTATPSPEREPQGKPLHQLTENEAWKLRHSKVFKSANQRWLDTVDARDVKEAVETEARIWAAIGRGTEPVGAAKRNAVVYGTPWSSLPPNSDDGETRSDTSVDAGDARRRKRKEIEKERKRGTWSSFRKLFE